MAPVSPLASFLKRERETILVRWEEEIREQSVAQDLDTKRLRDNVPLLLERMAEMADAIASGQDDPGLADLVLKHAKNRIESGYSVEELIVDHASLRQAIAFVLAERGPEIPAHEWVLVGRVVDRALVETVRHFLRSKERKLAAFERMAARVTASVGLQPLLSELIDTFLDAVPSADTASISICEDGRLVLRATRGLERDKELGMSVALGEGFAGKVASMRKPMILRNAAKDPMVVSQTLRDRGVQALYGVPLFHDEQVIGVATMGSRTAQEFAEDDMMLLRALAERASAAIGRARLVEQLESEAQLRDRLMAIVGHDLRTPLNALTMGAGHLLERDDMPEIVTRLAGRMLRSAERMRRIIDLILDFTRVRAGTVIPLQPTSVRLEDVAREVIDEITMAGPTTKIALRVEGDTTGTWDAERIRQVLANLLENAVAHGGGTVDLLVRGANELVEIAVHNGGDPIPPEALARIFEPFRKSTGSRGLGLGLYIAREVARAHGGDIEVRSRPNDGTTFAVKLPRNAPSSSPGRSALH